MSKRPFFSIIIPCYNDGRYKEGVYLDRLLNSICGQFLGKENVEVILADDCSPVPFADEMIEKFSGFITIKYIKTDYNFAPGNTREKGVSIATGEWICFADHDDQFYPFVLGKVKQFIEQSPEDLYVLTDFNELRLDGSIKKEFKQTLNWCHGKFYNLDNLWRKYNIHFIKDLASHEDIAICTQVNCIINSLGRHNVTYCPITTYGWTENPESLSHVTYIDKDAGDGYPHSFLETHYLDYLTSTGYITLDKYKEGVVTRDYAIRSCLDVLLYGYFYMQGFQFQSKEHTLKSNFSHSHTYLKAVKDALKITNKFILDKVAEDNANIYWKIRRSSEIATGPRVDTQTFKQWLSYISRFK